MYTLGCVYSGKLSSITHLLVTKVHKPLGLVVAVEIDARLFFFISGMTRWRERMGACFFKSLESVKCCASKSFYPLFSSLVEHAPLNYTKKISEDMSMDQISRESGSCGKTAIQSTRVCLYKSNNSLRRTELMIFG